MRSVRVVDPSAAETGALPLGIVLPTKDRPILLGAIAVGATHLLTGDVKHFGAYYRRVVAGILILAPSDYPIR